MDPKLHARPFETPDAGRVASWLKQAIACAAIALAAAAHAPSPASAAEPSWTTYHRDAGRSGYDEEAGEALAPRLDWHSVELGAPIWGEPLVSGGRVYVATVGDALYALDASTGAVVWSKSAGVPVPAEQLPCGDIAPTVGIVGTPVIDPVTQTVYAVADTWDEARAQAHHELVGYRLADGSPAPGLPVSVDPPGSDPKALLQRTALNLDGGEVVFGLGGNDGDCSDYLGTVVAAPESGAAPRWWRVPIAPPSSTGGAVWGASGPVVDGTGFVYATTGNPNPPSGQRATQYDYSDSVLKLGLSSFALEPASEPAPAGFFEPPDWEEASNSDLDLASAGAELLPGGVLFQAGKTGIGYLIEAASMTLLYEGEVCYGGGSFGGDAYAQGVIYLACSDGVEALSYDAVSQSFKRLWHGPADAFGPPIVAAGSVWSIATGGFKGGGQKLYGLDPRSGAPRFVVTLPSPVVDHFGTPSAAGGQLFVSTGSTVSAYTIATSPPASSSSPGDAPGASRGPRHRRSNLLRLLRRRLHVRAGGFVALRLRCLVASGLCRGKVVLRASLRRPRQSGARTPLGRQRAVEVLGAVRFRHRPGDFSVAMRLDRRAHALLREHRRSLAVEAVLEIDGGRTRAVACTLRR